jgi:hypothetical protein
MKAAAVLAAIGAIAVSAGQNSARTTAERMPDERHEGPKMSNAYAVGESECGSAEDAQLVRA